MSSTIGAYNIRRYRKDRNSIATYRNIHLIYNPSAGRLQRAKGALIGRVTRILEEQGSVVAAAPTSARGDATELARRAVSSGADLALVAGGDGTIHEAVNGLVHSRVPLGIIPGGTANVLATELRLARSPARAAKGISALVAERISVGLLTTPATPPRYFLLMAGVGLDAQVVGHIDLELKKRLGTLAFWIGGLGQLGRQFPQFDITVGDHTMRSGFALASRVRNYGGDLKIARTASLLDDYFELVAFEGEDSILYLKYLTGVLANWLPKMEGVWIHKLRKADFAAPPGSEIFVQTDGELAARLPATVEIVPDALTLLMPPSIRAKSSPLQDPVATGR